jgi:uncharacterized protein YbjT (DUF2867 family)
VLVLVIGASSEVGGRVASTLAGRGLSVRAMVRRSEAVKPARALGVAEVVIADLRDTAALARAFDGIGQAFLMSSPNRDQVELETAAIAAAEHAGTDHIVKISNIPIEGLESGLHGNHRAIERRLAQSPVAATVLQPSFFTSVLARQAGLIRRSRFVMPTGQGRIAWIDPRDIADVAAALLAGDAPGGIALQLTGPEALTADDVAARLGVRHLDPPIDEWRANAVAGGLDPWLADSTVHLYEAVARGALEAVSPVVQDVLGHPPRAIDDWITDVLRPMLREPQ